MLDGGKRAQLTPVSDVTLQYIPYVYGGSCDFSYHS